MRTFVLLALMLALFAVLFVPAYAQDGEDEGPLDPSLNEGEEVIEEIDTETTQQQTGGRPQMTPEEMERVCTLYFHAELTTAHDSMLLQPIASDTATAPMPPSITMVPQSRLEVQTALVFYPAADSALPPTRSNKSCTMR